MFSTVYITYSIFQQDIKKGVTLKKVTPCILIVETHYLLCLNSDDTETFLRPFALRRARTLRPFADAMRSLKPCLFLLFLLDGWYVLFCAIAYIL